MAIAARRNDRLDEVVADIAANGGSARSYALDVTDKSAVQSVVAAIIADFGRLDVLINNAGLMPIRPMAEVNTDEWDQMIDVNLKGTLYGIAAVLRLVRLGLIDMVVVKTADRIARDAAELHRVHRELLSLGVVLHSVTNAAFRTEASLTSSFDGGMGNA